MMHTPVAPESPMAKAMAASQAAAARRLVAAADALEAAMPSGGALFSLTMQRKGCAAVQVLFSWPGHLLALDAVGGEIIRESAAADMQDEAPVEAAFLARKTHGLPLKGVTFQPPQGQRLRATFGADGVLRVHAVKGGALLAVSEPGEPRKLCAGFQALTGESLAPRIQ